ncbi:MAG: alpha/beta fold hydrolase [Candidatus Heimdallarchaeota archaeon]|nr:MAG: alpha/beta fold hydrolase [Candidatus Heimdallarchaeota archaeon]
MYDVDPLALPFEFKGFGHKEKIGCLLLHSFTASPSEVRPLGIFLRNQGYSGIAPLLPGHGSDPNALRETTWLDWYSDSREGFFYLTQIYTKIVVIGIALGSVLATMLAASPEREHISGLILISPSQHSPSTLVKTVLPFLKYIKKDFTTIPEGIMESLNKNDDQFYYSKRPTEALIELYRVIGFTNKRLSLITQPTLIIHNENDSVNPDFIVDNLVNCPVKERWTHERRARWFFYGDEAQLAFEKIDNFIETNCM